MIQTFSSTIRRREMDAVLTCMVDEKIGPGELNARLIQNIKENFQCAGSVALRSPSIALHYALKAMNVSKDDAVIGRPNVDNPTNENTIASRNTNGNAAPSPSDK